MNFDSEFNLSEILEILDSNFSYKEICKMSDNDERQYKVLLEQLNTTNGKMSGATTAQKGKALEDVVTFLLLHVGKLFVVKQNIRNTTNEIDQLVSIDSSRRCLLGRNILDQRYELFLCECKNYHKKIGVTYVGKFCSLMMSCNVKLGILFSYHGITGRNWTDSSGLVKKFYLHREKHEDRYCLIDFNYNDFQSIASGSNFLQIVSDKMNSLRTDTDYSSCVSKHPGE